MPIKYLLSVNEILIELSNISGQICKIGEKIEHEITNEKVVKLSRIYSKITG